VRLRPVEPGDARPLKEFFRRLPASDRNFFKEDVLDARTVESWVRDERSRRALAFDDAGAVVGYAAVIPASGWSKHVGEIRLVVDGEQRRKGIGRALSRWAVLEAARMGLSKVFVEVVADQEAAMVMFQDLGFQAEALLKDHVLDRRGRPRDLVVLSLNLGDSYSSMTTLGMEQV
jgi:ribosomal protein S18 acetylase RimI-like enzyme